MRELYGMVVGREEVWLWRHVRPLPFLQMIAPGQTRTFKIVDSNQKRMLKSISKGGSQREAPSRFALVQLDEAAAAARRCPVASAPPARLIP